MTQGNWGCFVTPCIAVQEGTKALFSSTYLWGQRILAVVEAWAEPSDRTRLSLKSHFLCLLLADYEAMEVLVGEVMCRAILAHPWSRGLWGGVVFNKMVSG